MKLKYLLTLALGCAFCAANESQAALVGQWQFEEGSGAVAANSVGGGTEGVITNDTTGGLGVDGSVWVTDPTFGSVISFNGAADGAYVRAGFLPELMTLENDFTWSFLANNQSGDTTNIIVGNRRDGTENDADFSPRQFIKFTPTLLAYHMDGSGSDNLSIPSLPNDEWRHHAVVKQGDEFTYYLNGLPRAFGEVTRAQTEIQPLFFGGDNTSRTGENWSGFLDDVRIYDNALLESEVRGIVPASLLETLGDVNGDGSITINEDFEPIRMNFLQQVSTRLEGDLTKDGVVNLDDWNEFKTAFLANGGSLAELSALNVPEPSTAALLALLVSCGVLRRRR